MNWASMIWAVSAAIASFNFSYAIAEGFPLVAAGCVVWALFCAIVAGKVGAQP